MARQQENKRSFLHHMRPSAWSLEVILSVLFFFWYLSRNFLGIHRCVCVCVRAHTHLANIECLLCARPHFVLCFGKIAAYKPDKILDFTEFSFHCWEIDNK